jgi:hypothetical protein
VVAVSLDPFCVLTLFARMWRQASAQGPDPQEPGRAGDLRTREKKRPAKAGRFPEAMKRDQKL